MALSILDRTVDFYYDLFNRIFSEPFRSRISDRLKRDTVIRQVQESAAAASQSLCRFFLNEQLTEQQVGEILGAYARLPGCLKLDNIANSNVTPEAVVGTLLEEMPCPETVRSAELAAEYRLALHSIVQVLTLVGPVMAEWQKLGFSSNFELPRRVVNRLNEISQQLELLGRSGQAAADERFELTYRDYLLQRFHRVEAGTVRMTTNLAVDLRELFVMPRIRVRSLSDEMVRGDKGETAAPLSLAAARKLFGAPQVGRGEPEKEERGGIPLIEQVKKYPLNVIVGPPGSGKSTFLEWLQLMVASVQEEFIMAGKQAVPLLLRVRELDPLKLPTGADLIEKATESKDRATLMPEAWIDRQMDEGRVLFMLDGLDEIEPNLRDQCVLPWLIALHRRYPKLACIISSRPVGYVAGTLRALEFGECELLDFEEAEIKDYTRHWCTAVRLARNEPEGEARREGAKDGEQIVAGFKEQPYIRNLARNPLMLSAICLVNYFEGGELPKDRALLYKLCVEGLLHHWDQRRGIRSEFGLDQKLRVCREVALAMQADDRAEYEADKVEKIFQDVLGDYPLGRKLMEHVRYRSGLLLERRPGMYAFAHLTFQEYLAALAVHEGDRLGLTGEKLASVHADGRWNEVIALYCRVSTAANSREMIECLVNQPDTHNLSTVLSEAYFSASPEVTRDQSLRMTVLQRIALLPVSGDGVLLRFPANEVASIANRCVAMMKNTIGISESHNWLRDNPAHFDAAGQAARIRQWQGMNSHQMAELVHLLHAIGPGRVLAKVAADDSIYRLPGRSSQTAKCMVRKH